jgi:hypothetical protein
MTQADSASTTSLPFPTRAMPIAQPVGSGWLPVIYHPERTVEHLRFERFPRKAKATGTEALRYAGRVLAWREHFEGFKRRRREATVHPRFLEAAE